MNDGRDTMAALETLVAAAHRGSAELRRGAVAARDPTLRRVLLRRADRLAAAADELLRSGWLAAGPAPDDAAPPAAPATGAEALLAVCEQAERRALGAWCRALEQPLPTYLQLLLQRQCAALQRSHRRARVLLHLARTGDLALPPDASSAAAAPPPAAAPRPALPLSEPAARAPLPHAGLR